MVTENVQNPTDEFKVLKKLIAEVDLVVWDDIGAIKLTDYDHKNLLSFIDQRLLAEKANIYTGNLPYDSLVSALGQRLASRVYNDSSVIELFGQDRRGYYDRIANSE
jgi:DNA replication protein DnaC